MTVLVTLIACAFLVTSCDNPVPPFGLTRNASGEIVLLLSRCKPSSRVGLIRVENRVGFVLWSARAVVPSEATRFTLGGQNDGFEELKALSSTLNVANVIIFLDTEGLDRGVAARLREVRQGDVFAFHRGYMTEDEYWNMKPCD